MILTITLISLAVGFSTGFFIAQYLTYRQNQRFLKEANKRLKREI